MAPKLLAVDIGNSRIKGACLADGKVIDTINLAHPDDLLSWRKRQPTLPLVGVDTRRSPEWQTAFYEAGGRFLELKDGLPFETQYAPTLGPDRCAALIALYKLSLRPFLYLSFGSALTGDLVDPRGLHVGGFISAGLSLRLRGLAVGTGRLPWVAPPTDLPPFWATTTPEALASGAFWGLLAEVETRLRQASTKYPGLQLWASGGEAKPFLKALPFPVTFVPDLTLIGLWHWHVYLAQR